MSDSQWPPDEVPEEPAPSRPGSRAMSPRRRRGPLVPTLVVLGALAFLATGLAEVWTDILWYRSVNFSGVFTTTLLTRIGLGAAAFVLVAGLVWSSLYLAYRHRPSYVPRLGANESLEQYRDAIEPVRKLSLIHI